MDCAKCGEIVSENDKFCSNCGKKNQQSNFDIQNNSAQLFTRGEKTIPPDINKPIYIFEEEDGVSFHANKNMPSVQELCLEWIQKGIKVVLTDSSIIFIAGDQHSKNFEEITMLLAAAFRAFVVPIAAVVLAYDKLFGKDNQIERKSLEQLYDAGRVAIMPRENVDFQYIQIGGLFSSDAGNCLNLNGQIVSCLGSTNASVCFIDSVIPAVSDVVKGFGKAGYPLKQKKKKVKSLIAALELLGRVPVGFKL
jgi:zinc ribbon protein